MGELKLPGTLNQQVYMSLMNKLFLHKAKFFIQKSFKNITSTEKIKVENVQQWLTMCQVTYNQDCEASITIFVNKETKPGKLGLFLISPQEANDVARLKFMPPLFLCFKTPDSPLDHISVEKIAVGFPLL